MSVETLVPYDTVAEYLGVVAADPVQVESPNVAVNIGLLSTPFGVFGSIRDLERTLRLFARAEHFDDRFSGLLESVADQIVVAANLQPLRKVF